MSHVTALASWDADRQDLVLDDRMVYRAGLRKLKLEAGERVVIRVEREGDAATWAQFKYLFGYVFRPVADDSGHTEDELCMMAKVKFLPDDGRTSLTELNHDELRAFTESCERWLREEYPEAFALYDQRRSA